MTRGVYHRVQSGESLSRIGLMYGVPWPEIAAAQDPPIRPPYLIRPGQLLLVKWADEDTPEPIARGPYRLESYPTKHQWPRPAGFGIRWIVVHSPAAAAGARITGTRAYLRDNDRQVSYHYLVGDRLVYQLAGPDMWVGHAGSESSQIPGTGVRGREVNYTTIGVALHDAPSVHPLVEATGVLLVVDLIKIHGLPDAGVVLGHRETDPHRRRDPVGVDMEQFRAAVAAHL